MKDKIIEIKIKDALYIAFKAGVVRGGFLNDGKTCFETYGYDEYHEWEKNNIDSIRAISKGAKPEVVHCTQCGYHYDSLLKECPTCKGVKSMSKESIEEIYELFCDWYEDDGSYDEEIKAKLILALEELPPQEQVTVENIRKILYDEFYQIEWKANTPFKKTKFAEDEAQAIHDLVYGEKPPKAEE